MGHLFKKHFTLSAARRQLPFLRRAFRVLRESRESYQELDQQLSARVTKLGADIGGPAVAGLVEAMYRMQEVLRLVEKRGIVIKDADRGLVDFPALRDGEEVFLCWELGEPEIAFWHPLDEGYAGRQPL